METIKNFLRPLYVPIANWYYVNYSGPQRYRNLFLTIQRTKAKRIMEIGTWSADRAIQMIKESRKYNSIEEIEYYGFDLFEEMNDETFKSEISKRPPLEADVYKKLTQTGAKISLYKGDTMKTLAEAVTALPKMDFIYIDGGHSHETIANDWKYSEMLMHENTIVIFDDYWLNREDGGCKKIIDSLDRQKYKVELSKQLDTFDNKDFGRLEIRYAIVSLV
jgi:predicted O-methyltransferase YrrM